MSMFVMERRVREYSMKPASLLVVLRPLAAAHLFGLEVLVEKVQSLLVCCSTSSDGEHALASIIMGSLCDGNTSTRALPDVADLAAAATNDTSHHVGRDADVLCLKLLAVLGVRRRRATVEVLTRGTSVARRGKVSAVTCTVVRSLPGSVARPIANRWSSTCLSPHDRVVKNSSESTLLIIDEALANLIYSFFDTLGGPSNLDDTLSGLREHVFLCDHADSRCILDLLDLETLAADDRAHLVVRDEKTDSWNRQVVSVAW